jgi:large subunit ribosomal protein L6
MSRIGKAPISVPNGVDVKLSGDSLTVKGPKGELSHTLPEAISVSTEDGTLTVARANDERQVRALHGLTRSLIDNMVTGVTQGFHKDLDIVGVGYRATAKGKNSLELNLGFSHPVVVEAPDGIEFVVPQPTRVEVHGIDKQLVGQVAANIRAWRKPEPYKGKGVRYVDERVRRKAGKAGK